MSTGNGPVVKWRGIGWRQTLHRANDLLVVWELRLLPSGLWCDLKDDDGGNRRFQSVMLVILCQAIWCHCSVIVVRTQYLMELLKVLHLLITVLITCKFILWSPWFIFPQDNTQSALETPTSWYCKGSNCCLFQQLWNADQIWMKYRVSAC